MIRVSTVHLLLYFSTTQTNECRGGEAKVKVTQRSKEALSHRLVSNSKPFLLLFSNNVVAMCVCLCVYVGLVSGGRGQHIVMCFYVSIC